MPNSCILVVEDDPGIRESLELTLEMEGYEVCSAPNGKEALDRLSRIGRPAMVILDLMMPVMDGWTFAEEAKNHPVLIGVPIVVVTAFHDLGRPVENALKIIRKPIDVDALLATVKECCNGSVS